MVIEMDGGRRGIGEGNGNGGETRHRSTCLHCIILTAYLAAVRKWGWKK